MSEIEELKKRFLQLQEPDGISELDLNEIERTLDIITSKVCSLG